MSHRVVVDGNGIAWDVWEVLPTTVEKRDADAPGEPPPTTGERRKMRSARMNVSPAMRSGWLAMKSPTVRRRIAPIPEGWAELSDQDLLALVDRADETGAARRLIE